MGSTTKLASAILLIAVTLISSSCREQNPNIDTRTGEDALISHEVEEATIEGQFEYYDRVYIPVYSDIYIDKQNQNALLAATLSIRNTSHDDSLFVNRIEYYNTNGDLVRTYIENTISLRPMATINYVIEREDDTGGPGANFIVELQARNRNARPVIQAVMLGENGNKGFSFVTNGISVK